MKITTIHRVNTRKLQGLLVPGLIIAAAFLAGCDKAGPQTAAPKAEHKHEHKPPHGGTPVELGNEEYHVELVLEAASGRLKAYVMDGELENFVRIPAESFEITARFPGKEEALTFKAVRNNATGEKIGDTSLFEAEADWLKTTTTFDAVIKMLAVRGKEYRNIAFNFPKGNDTDEKGK